MVLLQNISLVHFKNYFQQFFAFEKSIVCFVGKNGVGKTTMLDAIYFLCYTKSYFTNIDTTCIQHNHLGMSLSANFNHTSIENVKCIIRENGKKEMYCNQELYGKITQHIGKLACVFIAPDDTQLITEGSENRRKFLDSLIAQIDKIYLEHLSLYTKYLKQRNAYLKSCQGKMPFDTTLIQHYNQQLHLHATYIVNKRCIFLDELIEECKKIYNIISKDKENIFLTYQTQLIKNSLIHLLENNLHKDIASERTNYGIHKDDIEFLLNNMPLKQVASQGQRKSFLFSVKLAQYILLEKHLNQKPILLLDDIFEKLDEERSEKLIEFIAKLDTQIFVTDTHKERVEKAFGIGDLQIIEIDV